MKTGGFIVGQLSSAGDFGTTKNPRIHPNEKSARTEAERLAKMDSTKSFVVLECRGIVQASATVWR